MLIDSRGQGGPYGGINNGANEKYWDDTVLATSTPNHISAIVIYESENLQGGYIRGIFVSMQVIYDEGRTSGLHGPRTTGMSSVSTLVHLSHTLRVS